VSMAFLNTSGSRHNLAGSAGEKGVASIQKT
jgi:hypothetical protein